MLADPLGAEDEGRQSAPFITGAPALGAVAAGGGEDPFDVRLGDCAAYFDRMYRDFIAAYGEEEKGWQAYGEYLHHGLFAIRRRTGAATLSAH